MTLGSCSSRRPQPIQRDFGAFFEVWVERHHAHRTATPGEVLDDLAHVDLARARPHRVDDGDRVAHLVVVAVGLQPVQRRRGAAGAVDGPRADHDQYVGPRQNRRHRRVQQPGTAVGEHQAVEPLQNVQGAGVVVGAECVRGGRITVRCQHFQPAGSLRCVAANVAVALDAVGVAQQVPHRGRRLERDLLAQCAAVGIGVDRDNPFTAQVGKGGPQGRGDRGLADTPFQRQHRDPVAAAQRAVDLSDQVVEVRGPRAFPGVDQPTRQQIEQPTPAFRRWRLDRPQQRGGGQFRIRRMGHRLETIRRPFSRAGRALIGAAVVGAVGRRVEPLGAESRN